MYDFLCPFSTGVYRDTTKPAFFAGWPALYRPLLSASCSKEFTQLKMQAVAHRPAAKYAGSACSSAGSMPCLKAFSTNTINNSGATGGVSARYLLGEPYIGLPLQPDLLQLYIILQVLYLLADRSPPALWPYRSYNASTLTTAECFPAFALTAPGSMHTGCLVY